MAIFGKVYRRFCQAFRDYYPYIWFFSVITAMIVGYLHFELMHNNRDLIYWKNLFDLYSNELEQFALILIVMVILIMIVFLAFIIVVNSRAINWFDELSQLEVKKRYADFLFMRLLANIDKIEAKYLRSNKSDEMIYMKSFMMAHEDMRLTIEDFRKDARKLLTPNEVEVTLPTEEVYGVMDDDERLVRRSRFYRMDITADDDLIKSLINP